ncbi:hypothetical protein JYU34_012454 [Plutella xylostella]|uniref:Uncharacterized protein n=1 Tax=Plutella xylostella TaxID=51655 RepID=A0ABQ7QBG8_PLUXY|nr:hypothetical protein JYU34_012454 [Plutella xylostella]
MGATPEDSGGELSRFLMLPRQNKPNALKLNSVARQASRYSARDPRLRLPTD